MLLIITIIACAAWAWLIYGQGQFWQLLLPQPPQQVPAHWPDVAIIVPARNEAAMLPHTLPALLAQDYPGRFGIILVDDHSTDNTAAVAHSVALSAAVEGAGARLDIIQPPALPADWRGKVHAMHAGVLAAGEPDFILFTDADILHQPSSLRYLVARAIERQLDLHSLMVKLRCESFWEKLLIPAFVYFFQLLYPFAWSNRAGSRVAAAAGGVMLVRTSALQEIGGLTAIKTALIDDCALARALKFRPTAKPVRTLLTLVDHAVVSLRPYATLGDIWHMISRSAFTQLRYSWLLLAATGVMLGIVFVLPVLLPFMGGLYSLVGFVLTATMVYSYLPLVGFYRLPFYWAVTLPVAALLYLGATIDSARHHAAGHGGQWKGRAHSSTKAL
jgi:hopene-associated glycosyltransferase HpnB